MNKVNQGRQNMKNTPVVTSRMPHRKREDGEQQRTELPNAMTPTQSQFSLNRRASKNQSKSMCYQFLALLLLALTTARPALAQGGNNNPGVVPPNAKYRGLTYGEWEARYWQALLIIPVVNGIQPFLTFGAFGGADGVVFLAPSYYQAGSYIIDVTIPAGTPLFMPVRVNAECSQLEPDPFHGDDEASLRQCANDFIDIYSSGYFASIDGRPVKNIDAYRSDSPLYVFGPLPEDNLFQFLGLDAPAGTTSLSVSAGYHLLLTPLSVGRHEVRVGATTYDVNPAGDRVETVFRITVAALKE
jgi:hypothetical protein